MLKETYKVKENIEQPYRHADLRYSAEARCRCGGGLVYPPSAINVAERPVAWHCEKVALGTAEIGSEHDIYPFAFYEIKSEMQPSAYGATTRPEGAEKERPYDPPKVEVCPTCGK